MLLDEAEIEGWLRLRLGCEVSVATVNAPGRESDLTGGELARLDALRDTPRLDSWLRGRAALKRLFGRLRLSADTSDLSFPHPRFSLTHSGPYAVAVAAGPPSPAAKSKNSLQVRPSPQPVRRAVHGHAPSIVGVGVDIELGKAPREAAARFFLTGAEQSALDLALVPCQRANSLWERVGVRACPQQTCPPNLERVGDQLLRLWTVKEALFKADPHNGGRTLLDYSVPMPRFFEGWAAPRPDSQPVMRYATMPVPKGFLTVAISLGPDCSRGD